MNTIIIDDEINSHKVLKDLLSTNHPEIKIIGSGFKVKEGLGLIASYSPDLVFLDIEMPDGTGFELLSNIPKPNFQVIFITAYNKYAISAIRSGAIDFLLKPIVSADLEVSILRAKERRNEKLALEQLKILQETQHSLLHTETKSPPARIAIYNLGEITYIDVKDIIHLRAEKGCTEFYLSSDPNKVVSSLNIGVYVELFEPFDEFLQIHRSFIINLLKVKKFKRADRKVILEKQYDAVVSRAYHDLFLEKMKMYSINY